MRYLWKVNYLCSCLKHLVEYSPWEKFTGATFVTIAPITLVIFECTKKDIFHQRNPTNAIPVIIALIIEAICESIKKDTLSWRNPTNVISANTNHFWQVPWKHTWLNTLRRSRSNVTHAILHQSHSQSSKGTRWYRVESNLTNVTSVAMHHFVQTFCGATKELTQESNPLNATSAVLPQLRQVYLINISRDTME